MEKRHFSAPVGVKKERLLCIKTVVLGNGPTTEADENRFSNDAFDFTSTRNDLIIESKNAVTHLNIID